MSRIGLSLQFPALDRSVRALLGADPEIAILDDDSGATDVQIMTAAVFAKAVERAAEEVLNPSPIIILGAEGWIWSTYGNWEQRGACFRWMWKQRS